MKRAAVFLGVMAMVGCSAKKVYPEADLGWHDAGHTVIFGTLQRVMGRQAEGAGPPIWVIRYSAKDDAYGGELALTPPERLTGYSGGEKVEIRGEVRPELSYPDYPGKWFAIRSIRMWAARR